MRKKKAKPGCSRASRDWGKKKKKNSKVLREKKGDVYLLVRVQRAQANKHDRGVEVELRRSHLVFLLFPDSSVTAVCSYVPIP